MNLWNCWLSLMVLAYIPSIQEDQEFKASLTHKCTLLNFCL